MVKISRLFSTHQIKRIHQNAWRFFCQKQQQQEKEQREDQKINKQQEEKEQKEEEERRSRQTEADEENEQSQKKQKIKDESFKVSRYLFMGSLAILGYNIYIQAEEQKDSVFDVFPFNSTATYILNKYRSVYNFMVMPPSSKLLPDQIVIPGLTPVQYPKTLVLDLDAMVYTDYEIGKGLLIVKRPGLSKFLNEMRKRFEIVVFSNRDLTFVENVCMKLDPKREYFSGAFGQESTVKTMQGYVKDLKYLNRSLGKIIVIEKNPQHVSRQPENAIIVDSFDGKNDENLLYKMTPFLDHLSKMQVKDVRQEIQAYGGNESYQRYFESLMQRQQKIESQKKKFSGFGFAKRV